jgi:hypothetical protein
MQPAKQEHHKAMIRAFRGNIDVGKENPAAVQVESSSPIAWKRLISTLEPYEVNNWF